MRLLFQHEKVTVITVASALSLLAACSPTDAFPTDVAVGDQASADQPEIAQPSAAFANEFTPKYNASPRLPPDYSVSRGIWPEGIPAAPIRGEPQFIDHPEPELFSIDEALIEEAKCSRRLSGTYLDCTFTSPLMAFDCHGFRLPVEITSGLEPDYPIVAECLYEPNDTDEANDEYVYRAGCLYADNIGYIFEIDEEYVLVNTAEEMQELFAPIESPEEALAYAQMLTGMQARQDFYLEPEHTVYFTSVLEDTYVTQTDPGYVVHLYHSQVCGCDTYLTSKVDVIVNRNGAMAWGDTSPAYLEIYMGMCVD
jgi:hypothetical protein